MSAALLILRPFLPYLIGGGLAIAVTSGLGVWWWHSSTVSGLEEQLQEAKDTATGLQTAMDEQTIAYADRQIAAKTAYATALEVGIAKRSAQEKQRADANLALAREARQNEREAKESLVIFEEEFAKHQQVCSVSESIVCLLAAASGAPGAHSDHCPRMPEATATPTPSGRVDEAAEASGRPSAVPAN